MSNPTNLQDWLTKLGQDMLSGKLSQQETAESLSSITIWKIVCPYCGDTYDEKAGHPEGPGFELCLISEILSA